MGDSSAAVAVLEQRVDQHDEEIARVETTANEARDDLAGLRPWIVEQLAATRGRIETVIVSAVAVWIVITTLAGLAIAAIK